MKLIHSVHQTTSQHPKQLALFTFTSKTNTANLLPNKSNQLRTQIKSH